jgi:hypothetical protein
VAEGLLKYRHASGKHVRIHKFKCHDVHPPSAARNLSRNLTAIQSPIVESQCSNLVRCGPCHSCHYRSRASFRFPQ